MTSDGQEKYWKQYKSGHDSGGKIVEKNDVIYVPKFFLKKKEVESKRGREKWKGGKGVYVLHRELTRNILIGLDQKALVRGNSIKRWESFAEYCIRIHVAMLN